MEISSVIASLCSLIAGGGIAGIFLIRERKRAEHLRNEASAAEQWRLLFERSDNDNREKDARIDKLYGEQTALRERNNKLSTDNAVLKLSRCDVKGCERRKPPRGY